MTDGIPDNVDLKWIARQLVELHGDLCGFREDVGPGEQSLRGEFHKLRQSLDNLGAVLRPGRSAAQTECVRCHGRASVEEQFDPSLGRQPAASSDNKLLPCR